MSSELEPASSGFLPICPSPMITEVLARSVRCYRVHAQYQKGSRGGGECPCVRRLGCEQQET